MNPIPAEVAERWSPMWPKTHHPQRPWWIVDGRGFYRVDNLDRVVYRDVHHFHFTGFRKGTAWKTDEEMLVEMALIDAAYPMPMPPMMPGQVWTWKGDHGGWLEDSVVRIAGDGNWIFSTGLLNVPRDAILVSGPTPWGRDVPWSPE